MKIKTEKKKAWDNFSRYVRLRDAIRTTKTKDKLLCITCDKPYKAFGVGCAQAGHFIPGRKNAVLIDERFVNGQCYHCNHHLRGNWVIYEAKMIERYGKKEVENAKIASKRVVKRSAYEWQEIAEEYKEKYNEMYNKEL